MVPAMNFWQRRGGLLAYVVAVLTSLPAMFTGPFHDDFLQHLGLEGALQHNHVAPHLVYEFTEVQSTAGLIHNGAAPWFTHPDFSMRFFRPLSSLVIAGEHAVFGRATLPTHLLSLAWFLVLLSLAIAIYRRTLSPARAGLASVIFAAAGGHTMNLAWVSSRHTLVGATLGASALWLHLRRREPKGDRPSPVWAAPAAVAVTMLASETALAAVALIVSYELLGRDAAWRDRLRGAAPFAAMGAAYVVAYSLAGYGVAHSGMYISPMSHPVAFVVAAGARIPVLIGEMAGSFPADLWAAAPPLRPVLFALGIVFAVLLAVLLRRGELSSTERRQVGWLSTGAVLAVFPMVGGVLGGRLLALPLLASAAVVATTLDVTLRRARATRRLTTWAAVATLFTLHFGLASLVRVALPLALRDIADKERRVAVDADLGGCPDGSIALLMSGGDPTLSLYAEAVLTYFTPERAARLGGFRVMSMTTHDQRIERVSENEIVLVVEGERTPGPFEGLFRDAPLAVGDAFDTGAVVAEVEAVKDGLATRVRFEVPAESCILTWRDATLRGSRLPPVGEALSIPHEPGPMGL